MCRPDSWTWRYVQWGQAKQYTNDAQGIASILDLYMPQRFDLTYVDSSGGEQQVVVIHRAPLGSHERSVWFLIEHFAGAFPVWLGPVQAVVTPIADCHHDYARKVQAQLGDADIRVDVDDRNERMNAKIREARFRESPTCWNQRQSGVSTRLRS